MEPLLGPAQARAYAALSSRARFFLRRSADHGCLWVSDLPRHLNANALENAASALRAQGFLVAYDIPVGLLRIDLSLAEYEALLAPLPHGLPPLPYWEAHHPAYALCRLLLLHPAPLEEQPFAPLREMLKAACLPKPALFLRLRPSLHGQCALWLRERKPLPHAAGRVLSAWLAASTPSPSTKEDPHDSAILRA